ncbi:unnamed protein product [Vitrella brassicaformis CCMP3155]|uniref:Inositol-1-monophosphatase n=2 Tax=Vitrella brassicaformis TaxID=1169539 RepID=A0A0G4EQ33_VITBC|nr:unnamed protein product [Vitrella brassicaformis CCMP3155]|eukprot:CEL99396.1 unnamed protein product [Vitrella brassicaformis CCMP3155]
MTDPEVTIEFVRELAQSASDMIGQQNEASTKQTNAKVKVSAADLVTETDVAVENLLKQTIHSRFPTHQFLCEESSDASAELTDAPTWIIDPVDGTTNFYHGVPYCCVSIAFARHKTVLFGCVQAPLLKEAWWAEKGGKAWHMDNSGNVKCISTSTTTDLNKSLLSTGFLVATVQRLNNPNLSVDDRQRIEHKRDLVIRQLQAFLPHVHDVRRLGACALDLCHVACGRMDCYFECGPKEWDLSAGVLIVYEAGGVCSNYAGAPLSDKLDDCEIVACATPELHDKVIALLKQVE